MTEYEEGETVQLDLGRIGSVEENHIIMVIIERTDSGSTTKLLTVSSPMLDKEILVREEWLGEEKCLRCDNRLFFNENEKEYFCAICDDA